MSVKTFLACITTLVAASRFVGMESNINADHKLAWGENIGWTNWQHDTPNAGNGVLVGDTWLAGFVWAENTGWINLGDGAPADGVHYANIDGSEFGVNIDPDTGRLFGMGWGENMGWINFDTSGLGVDRGRFDACDQRFFGYAWGENIGWINLNDATHFVSVVPEVIVTSPQQPAGEAGFATNRYLSFIAGNATQQTAVRLTLIDVPAPNERLNGTTAWVGTPQATSEDASVINVDPESATFLAAPLTCTPLYMDWGALGNVHVFGESILPGGTYVVQVIDERCDVSDETRYSAPLEVITSACGDLTGRFLGGWPPPDGSVDVPFDIVSIVEKFRNLPGAPIKARVDLAPSLPNQLINIGDIVIALDAFRGLPCPFRRVMTPCAR